MKTMPTGKEGKKVVERGIEGTEWGGEVMFFENCGLSTNNLKNKILEDITMSCPKV